jgi:hypothetical protein
MPGGKRQEAGSSEPAGRRRRRASLSQPMVLRIAHKAAAAVLLSVNRAVFLSITGAIRIYLRKPLHKVKSIALG